MTRGARTASAALTESIAVAGVAALVAVVYLVIVAGINGVPKGHERSVLLSSLAAAIAVALLALPVRNRLIALATAVVGKSTRSTEEVASTFSARMSRAVPMDELLLQLAESLRASVADAGAEIWTGTDGVLTRAVSVPDRGPDRLRLGEREQVVIGQARIGGHGWSTIWLPALLDPAGSRPADRADRPPRRAARPDRGAAARSTPRRSPKPTSARSSSWPVNSASPCTTCGWTRRCRPRWPNWPTATSSCRPRGCASSSAADASRRAIERNLHDGAQQHLVALAVKLGLAQQIVEDGDLETVQGLLGDLRADVQVTIKELRELAHGIYPPLLRDRGLGEALRTAATRSTLPCTVDVDLPGRFPEEVETAAYFCCLEAMQNAGKYAGTGATLRVHVGYDNERLCIELVDDGAGFEVNGTALGHGFVNMQDRLGAIGGELHGRIEPRRRHHGAGQHPGAAARASRRARRRRRRDRAVSTGRIRCRRRRLRAERPDGRARAGRARPARTAGRGGRPDRRGDAHRGADAARLPPRRRGGRPAPRPRVAGVSRTASSPPTRCSGRIRPSRSRIRSTAPTRCSSTATSRERSPNSAATGRPGGGWSASIGRPAAGRRAAVAAVARRRAARRPRRWCATARPARCPRPSSLGWPFASRGRAPRWPGWRRIRC